MLRDRLVNYVLTGEEDYCVAQFSKLFGDENAKSDLK